MGFRGNVDGRTRRFALCGIFGFAGSLAVIAALAVLLLVPSVASATALPSTIKENMTLTAAGSPYTNSGSVKIESGVTVNAEPGAEVKVDELTVSGTLKTEGTAEKPVLFTSQTDTKAGQWKGIAFNSGSGASVLDHAEVRYTGSNAEAAIRVNSVSPTIKSSTIHHNTRQAIYASGGSPDIANNLLYNNGGSGVVYYAPSGSGEVRIHGNQIEESEKYGVFVETKGSSVTGASLGENTIKANTTGAIFFKGGDLPPDLDENTLSGNGGSNKVLVSGSLSQSATWTDHGQPFRIEEGSLTVASGGSLTLGAGFTLKFENQELTVSGTLKTEGTAEKPVLFTSQTDTKAGQWKGIAFNSGSGASVLDHAEVRYTGSNAEAAIRVNSVSPTIKSSTIHHNTRQAIYASGGSPDIANNLLYNNGGSGVVYYAPSGSGEVRIHGNQIEESEKYGVFVETKGSSVTGASLGENTIKANTTGAIFFKGGDLPPDLDENTLSGNGGSNKVLVSGSLSQSATWTDHGQPFRIEEGSLTVASGGSLTLGAGFTLKFENQELTVSGTLKTEGTAEKPVLFTSVNEEGPGEWKMIKFEPGSGSSLLDHAEVAYGGSIGSSGLVEVRGSSPKISNSTIRKAQYYGVKVTESGSPTIEWNRFRGNTNGLSYSGTGNLSAPNNDWGCASGPKPAGCGDSVTSNVSWEPSVQLPELAGHCRGSESQCGKGADPVSLATGQLDYSHRDLLLTNKSSAPLEFVRAYTSGSESDTGLGPGWSQTGLASAMELESGEIFVLRQDGRQDLFQKTESGYKAPSGVTDALTKVEGTFRLTTLQNTAYAFDASGRIASITDDHGLKTTYAYDENGRLATITDPSAQTLTFTYNASNHITLVKDSTGREVKFAYSAADDLETVTDALGGVTKYAYDVNHRLTSITDPRSNVILKNTYDGQGRIVEQKDGLENLWKLEYKEGETVVTEPEGGELKYGFDGQDRVVSETDQLGNKTTTAYDAAGNVKEVVKPGGAKWTFGHDAAGNLTSVKDSEGGERKYEYDAQNRLTGFTDARGNAWSYEWSEANDLTKVTDPEEGETTFTCNASGQPLTVTDPNEHKTEFSYDSRGNRLSQTDGLSHKTSFEYDSRNHLTSVTAPGLKAESFERNALGDLLARTTPEGNKTKYAYDGNGMPTQITDPSEGVWKITYNAMERPTTYTDPLEAQTKVAYDGNLKPTKVTDRRGKETTYGYDAANQLTEVSRPEGGDWTLGYDSRGNRSSVIDPREEETAYEYDLLDRMTVANEPLGISTEYGYDANGELISVTDPRENETTYEYDKLGRLTEVAQPLEKTTTYTYDAVGNPLSKATAAGTLEYEYDAADRLSAIKAGEATLRSFGYDSADRLTGATDAESNKIELGYDNDSRITSINDGRGQSISRIYNSRGLLTKQEDGRGTLEYEYDKLGRTTSLTDPQSEALSFAYDAEGDLTKVERPNGVTTTNVYDDAGRLAETTSKDESATTLEALEYGYDLAGNIISKLDARLEAETTFAYDALNRLTEFNPPGEGATAYDYDAAGNRTEAGATTYEFNALNQLTEASDGTTYSYDGAGRMTGMESGEEETTYEWDLFDHLAKAESPAGTASYAFDALERLSERKSGESTQVVHYGDLTDLPTYGADGEGETTTSYVSGPRGLVEQRSGEATSYPLRDAHGDITAIADAAGEVTSRQSYDPWGAQLSGPTVEMGYLGAQQRRFDPTSGLIQMGARSYSPVLGRFMSEDPVLGHLGIGTSFNRHAYVWDNPLNLYDLDGLDVCVPTPFGDACAEEAAEDIGNAAGNAAGGAGSAAESAWNWTQPGRQWVSERAQDFFKTTQSLFPKSDGDAWSDLFCEKTYYDSYVEYSGPMCEESGSSPDPEELPTFVPGVDPPQHPVPVEPSRLTPRIPWTPRPTPFPIP